MLVVGIIAVLVWACKAGFCRKFRLSVTLPPRAGNFKERSAAMRRCACAGGEFNDDGKLSAALGCNVYYTRAYASYEKGSVENCNRLVRRWYPKGTDFAEVSFAEARRLERTINSIHRRMLGGMTAYEYAASLGVAA